MTFLNEYMFFCSSVSYGVTITAGSLVGISLGANCPNKAWRYAFSTIALGCFISLFSCCLLLLFEDSILNIYHPEEKVLELIHENYIIYLAMLFVYLWSNSLYGILRGMGYQSRLALLNFISLWLVNLPLSIVLIFPLNLRFVGIWISMLVGFFMLEILIILTLAFAPWAKIAIEASSPQQSDQTAAVEG